MATTTLTSLAGARPQSETQWRALAARSHRLRGQSGDEAAALTHELMIVEIRSGAAKGSSMKIRYCQNCLNRGYRYILLFIGGQDRCGTCGWG